MSLLQRFAILFDTNASKASNDVKNLDKSIEALEKDLNKTDKSVQDLASTFAGLTQAQQIDMAKKLGVDESQLAEVNKYIDKMDALDRQLKKTSSGAEKSGDSFDDLKASLKATAAAWLGFEAIKGGIFDSAANIDALGKMATRLNESIGDLDAWQEAAVRFGGSADGITEDFKRMNDQANDFAQTEGGAGADIFKRFGIRVKTEDGELKKGSDLITELADKVKGLSNQEISGIGEMLGFSEGTIAMLQQGRTAIEMQINRQKQLGVATQEQADAAAKFNDQWADTIQIFKNLSVSGSSTLLPMLTSILKGFEKFVFYLKDNQHLVEGFFIAIASIVATVYGPAMVSAAAATIAATWPLIAMGAAIAALVALFVLAYDDVMNFFEGNKSVTAELVKMWDNFTSGLTSSFSNAWDSIKEKFMAVYNWFADKFAALGDLVPDFMKDGLTGGIETQNTMKYRTAADGANAAIAMANTGASSFTQFDAQKDAAATAFHQANSTNNQSVKIGKVEVVTQATDAEGISKDIKSDLEKQIQAMQANFDTGMKA